MLSKGVFNASLQTPVECPKECSECAITRTLYAFCFAFMSLHFSKLSCKHLCVYSSGFLPLSTCLHSMSTSTHPHPHYYSTPPRANLLDYFQWYSDILQLILKGCNLLHALHQLPPATTHRRREKQESSMKCSEMMNNKTHS